MIRAVVTFGLLLPLFPLEGGMLRAQAAAPQTAAAEAYLRPGDKVKLRIWREEDWSGDYPVSENGMIVFPRIGERSVLKLSTRELRDLLLSEYNKYLQNPSIEITFQHRVNILGAVREPGLYHVDRTMSIDDALALAGGVEQEGKPNEVQLYRGNERVVSRVRQGTRLSEISLESGDRLFVPERSWASRNMPAITGAVLSGVISLLVVAATK